ncbi:CRISPR-associated exonuclease Cas4 [Acetoanaerobium pronyense]|uniref:CRISPR-associated exonuclease Cas4 n=1 Tax=Acetoanaerobium pronyense TaxID=1482736 RepID=A0ABS4KHL1_9FIRM|nr:CRISPR-associated protein Cas4 [Acetoanaerobium pronyense]MBP2027280.1 CRISPR-associated exonuclease Cas4 [Acetoanaerobium pronyense]
MTNPTGVMIYYYFVCKRKLWFFCKDIKLEDNSEDVGIGKLIDETSYQREKKHINIDNIINIDFIKDWEVLHDIKKSRSIEEASIWQLKYYIYYLRKKGVNIEKGILDYPKLKRRIDVFLDDIDNEAIEKIIKEIDEISNLSRPLERETKKICKKCAYYELCFV